ncbi:hypothetical protein NQ318_021508 [Aromia moschata]|uniref:NADP-dependent oxidoreductase domain-containing protein n=1 Tax=Aromia moschata TaxID=1265417 RepID=A0AAV8ZET4_9CUCU|nr:hypothetical protein NQ318_021508 [Aromia moschata]
MPEVPKVKLNNGHQIPIFGLGTWKSKPGEVEQAVKDAIDLGYRHIDCAHVYGNEKEVGAALSAKFKEGVIKRDDIFITSKLWNTYHRPDLVEKNIRITLKDLGLDYLDLYLIHWPLAYKEEGENFPFDANGKIQFSEVDYVDTWKAMEELVRKGLTKSIGVSNFNKRQIERILSIATIKPALNQETHRLLQIEGHCGDGVQPLGSPDRPWAKPGEPQLLDDLKLKELAAKYKKTPAQILLRYQIERGVVTIPKSVTKSRIEQNFTIFDFSLSKDDVAYLDTFDCNGRFCPMTGGLGHPHHPFEHDDY